MYVNARSIGWIKSMAMWKTTKWRKNEKILQKKRCWFSCLKTLLSSFHQHQLPRTLYFSFSDLKKENSMGHRTIEHWNQIKYDPLIKREKSTGQNDMVLHRIRMRYTDQRESSTCSIHELSAVFWKCNLWVKHYWFHQPLLRLELTYTYSLRCWNVRAKCTMRDAF